MCGGGGILEQWPKTELGSFLGSLNLWILLFEEWWQICGYVVEQLHGTNKALGFIAGISKNRTTRESLPVSHAK